MNDCFYIMNKLLLLTSLFHTVETTVCEHVVFRALQPEQLHLESLGNLTVIEITLNQITTYG